MFEDVDLSNLPDLAYNPKYEERLFLREFDGTFRADDFGIDVVLHIAGSLIGQALYQPAFDIYGLNENCLFSEPEEAKLFAECYMHHAAKGEIEPPADGSPFVLCLVCGSSLPSKASL